MTKLGDVYGKTRVVTQREAYPGKNQVLNAAGGFVFSIDAMKQLERFLILGTEGGTYYVGEHTLTVENAKNVANCLLTDGPRTLATIKDISVTGRAPKNDYALFALAMCVAFGDSDTRASALVSLPEIARTGTHLFQFLEYLKGMRSNQVDGAPKMRWNRSLRREIGNWYLTKDPDKLAYQLVKYQSRKVEGKPGWSHKDILSLTHTLGRGSSRVETNALFDYVTHGFAGNFDYDAWEAENARRAGAKLEILRGPSLDLQAKLPELINGFETLKGVTNPKEVVASIQKYGLTREMVPTETLNDVSVWEALLQKMPMTAMIRNLGKMTNVGLLTTFSEGTKIVLNRLGDQDYLRKSRIHPIAVLAALLVYKQGRGFKGSLTWTPVPAICDALDKAFYKTFANAPTTNKNFYIGVDCSGSMSGGCIAGIPFLIPIVGAVSLALVTMNNEPLCEVRGYSNTSSMIDIRLTKNTQLDEAAKKALAVNWGGTDCALPYKDALARKLPIDVFVNITDNETWAGSSHPFRALEDYRQKTGRNAYQIVIGMTATSCSIADPNDVRSLDVVGFDTNVPSLLAGFVSETQAPKTEVEED